MQDQDTFTAEVTIHVLSVVLRGQLIALPQRRRHVWRITTSPVFRLLAEAIAERRQRRRLPRVLPPLLPKNLHLLVITVRFQERAPAKVLADKLSTAVRLAKGLSLVLVRYQRLVAVQRVEPIMMPPLLLVRTELPDQDVI